MVVYLLELIQDLTDQAFEIHDRQIMSLLSKGRKAQEERQNKMGNQLMKKWFTLLTSEKRSLKLEMRGTDPYIVLEMIMPWEKLVQSVEEAKQLARPIDYDYLDLLEKKFYTLRKYTPLLLKSFEFHSTKSAEPLIRAIHTVREMNETGKRKVPEGALLILYQIDGKSTYMMKMEPLTGIIMKWLF